MSDAAAADQLTAALADRYRIERELGQGGMATVYLAHDLRHDRDVAIKVLHPELAAALGSERFLSEIKTTAKLQHPHILPLLDSGEAAGLLFYVMPYVSGETLRTRLERERQLPIADALRIAREAADALGAAHTLGIVHRDIKPENILLQGGHALVADFGIALAVQSAGGARMTQTGLSLGTPQYMSPEQALGEKNVDSRADVYALGAVTYEMLTGEPPFTGSTVQAIIAKLMTDPPRPLSELRKSVPVHVEAAVLAALEKVPADRIASAAAFSHALEDTGFATSATSTSARARQGAAAGVPRRWLVLALALNAVLAAAALLAWARKPPVAGTSRQHVILWQHRIPYALAPGASLVGNQAAIAPDGSSIVYTDSSASGYMLMRKLREAGEATPLAGTEGGVSPFFSPDGKWIGYFTVDNKVKKVPVAGGGSVTIGEIINPDYKAGAWLDDGTIVFSGDMNGSVKRVSADGGAAAPVRIPEKLGSAATLSPLPGGRGFLFTACPGNCANSTTIYAYDLKADSALLLVPNAAGAWYSPAGGQLLYTIRDGGLYAAAFDLGRMALTSGAVPLIQDVEPTSFTLSASGAALYTLGSAARTQAELVWVGRDGRATPFDSTWRGRFEYPKLSPDGRELAVSIRDKKTDLWIRRADGTTAKVEAEGAANWRPSWLPDGRSLTFVSVGKPEDQNDVTVYQVRTDGSSRPQQLQQAPFGIWEAEVSHDGQWLVLRLDEEGFNSNFRLRRLSGDTAVKPLLVEPSFTLSIALSPDVRWLAYTSNQTGQYELYVSPVPDLTSKRMVSSGGGAEPRWSADGRELYFVSGGKLMVVTVPPGASFNPGAPRPLFSVEGYRRARNHPQYDVAPDGRFLMIREPAASVGAVYAENWLAELLAKIKR
ncbi:MAG TPA: protein kinase [Gemmatimonadales bacterium]|nr:protein kinase [Gemmatimonadales bacterium]